MSQTYFAKGNRLFRENRLEEAVREYRRALKQQETFYAYENLGMALERLQREAEARRAYTESLRLNARAVRAARYLEQHGVPVPAPPKGKRAAPASPSAPQGKPPAPEEVHPVEMIRQASRAIDVAPLKADYHRQGLDQVADTFCLVRVVGNDLYPRHKKGQSRENVRFILENEPDYPGLTKLWIVNRIVDPSEREAILALLAAHDQAFLEISFDAERYAHLPFDTDSLPDVGYLNSAAFSGVDALARNRAITATYRLKNNYVMNNNGARNVALAEARKRAKWALPWDGNCYLTPDAWQAIQQDVTAAPWFSHFVVPMARMLSNDDLISNAAPPDPVEEPQLIFRCDTDETFNEAFCYGRRPKVELFWALGIPGKWDRWKDDPWDLTRRDLLPGARRFALAGWVARLYSGMGSLEQNTQESFKNRGRIRQDAIIATLRHLDKRLARGRAYPQACQFFQQADLKRLRRDYRQGEDRTLVAYVERLLADAEEALQRGPYSVVEKTTLPPSGDRHDYWHPAPYWWPDPDKPDGLPYIRRDGERVPGTRLYEPESDKYDRTRLQRVFDDSTALMLAWHFTGERRYAEHAARIFERFFIAPQTRMNPHLNYAQVRMGHGNNLGASTGIIEFKDFYYYLDAVRLLEQAKVLEPEAFDEFRAWLGEYQTWLLESPQGRKECQGANNHGTYYDLHLAAVAAYLGDEETLYDTLVRAQGRIAQQVTDTGEQPDELSRTTSQHYCHYNLQGFLSLALLARNWGVDLLHYEAQGGASLKKAVAWLLERAGRAWEHQQIDAFDAERSYPIYHFARALGDAARQELETSAFALKGRFFPHDGIAPYWQLMVGREPVTPVVFAIPLMARELAEDWEAVCRNLEATLASVANLGDARVRAIVCGHDRPDLNATAFPGLAYEFIQAPHPVPGSLAQGTADKREKLIEIGCHLHRLGLPRYQCMFLDADDWVRGDLLQYLDSSPADAWSFQAGYRLDVANGTVMKQEERFHNSCGSTFMFTLDREMLPHAANRQSALWCRLIGHHTRTERYAERCGSVEVLHEPLVAYLINHANSLDDRAKQRTRPLTKPDSTLCLETLRAEFGQQAAPAC